MSGPRAEQEQALHTHQRCLTLTPHGNWEHFIYIGLNYLTKVDLTSVFLLTGLMEIFKI